MSFSQGYRPYHSFREVAARGALVGIAGGVAELAFLGIYLSLGGGEPAATARAVAAAAHLGAWASTGVAVHILLSVVLGVAFMGTWLTVRSHRSTASTVYLFMAAASAVVWSFSFLVLLPSLDPVLADLLPYPVTFAATLVYALAGAPVLQQLANAEKPSFARSALHSPWTRF